MVNSLDKGFCEMRVRIFRPSISVTQSAGSSAPQVWRIEPELGPRAPEPLMGWIAADDPFASMRGRLAFPSCAEAEAFAHKQGWATSIEAPNEKKFVPRNYLENFNPDRRRDGR